MSDWNVLLMGGKELPLWGFFVRATVLYWIMILITRLMGKRQIGILSGHNYLVAAGIVAISASRMTNPEHGLIEAVVILLFYSGMNILQSFLDMKFPGLIDRKPIVLIENGRILKKNLFRALVSIDELMGQLRIQGAHNPSQVAYATLEANGKVSVTKKFEYQPIQRKTIKLPETNVYLPHYLIYDGEVQHKNLEQLGLDIHWLNQKLLEKGISDPRSVFLAMLEDDGTLYISAGE
ncbi:YetF domain-containing protein [Effusibacillus consociatus]|uniref:YetF domain-containing protein n=1 Tax=Effusibacillus consociatus TaxID=1117041 RepID=A0ABV9Q549_9BACL